MGWFKPPKREVHYNVAIPCVLQINKVVYSNKEGMLSTHNRNSQRLGMLSWQQNGTVLCYAEEPHDVIKIRDAVILSKLSSLLIWAPFYAAVE